MALPRISAGTYRQITLAALIALFAIIVTGGAVRLTGSGLGCPDWPTCARHHLVAPADYHAVVEFVNRVFTGAVSVAVILAVLGSLRREPRRRDLVWLSAGLVAGVLAQIVLGGLTVLYKLRPPFVMGHFLLSLVILGGAVILHERADENRREATAPLGLVQLGRLLFGATTLVVVLGTVVTSSGPHGGDKRAARLPYALRDVARLHGIAVMILLALTAVTVGVVIRSGVALEVVHRAEVLLAALVGQAAVGYVQYFTKLPAALVGVHIAGAAAVWVAVVRFNLVLRTEAVPA